MTHAAIFIYFVHADGKVTVSSYIADSLQLPVRPIQLNPSLFILEASGHTAINARALRKYLPLSTARFSFVQLSAIEQIKELSVSSMHSSRRPTRHCYVILFLRCRSP